MRTDLNKISKEYYEAMLGMHAEVVLENAIEQRLRRLIDQALDRWDEATFRQLAAELAGRKAADNEQH
ncbi:IDEAL domain-containing protein [Paenibacillus sp. HN-1]|uniref:IDEAL domain-containing protein n=1 Tax=Paenibacillus TaxID=44249 RepID=UPI001CA99C76|nr:MULTISPECIES: IDEAL domain-containing protein [Paenibacillus]MBY9081033.1 IDEAL domain-containing protein [Paenibacillus sp. CGMCC 1.18879]MBY9087070.1 IDEAL domain-containing protein [Paenibacillus sinensis]